MSKLASFARVGVATAFFLTAGSAYATNERTYIKSNGADSGTCTITTPCSSVNYALSQTIPFGIISCLDALDDTTPATISKSITIDCGGTVGAIGSLLITGTNVSVTVRNATFFNWGGVAILFQGSGTLSVENCHIFFNTSSTSGAGISFQPNGAGQLVVTESFFRNNGASNGNGAAGGGISVQPQAGGSAEVVLNRVTVSKNAFGIAADGTGSTTGINMTIADSVTDANTQDGIVATTPSGGAPIGVMVKNTRSTNNGGYGIRSIGTGVTVRVSGSTVIGNGAGLAFLNGGALLTYGNNEVIANGTNGSFSGSLALQ